MDPIRKHINQILHNQKHGKENGESAIEQIDGDIFMTTERISVRVLPYVNSSIGAELRKKFFAPRSSYIFGTVSDQMSSIYGIWHHKAGEYWPLVRESLQNYMAQAKQNCDLGISIKEQLQDFINNNKPQYLAELVLEERIHRINTECKGKKAKQKISITRERDSFKHYMTLLKIAQYNINK